MAGRRPELRLSRSANGGNCTSTNISLPKGRAVISWPQPGPANRHARSAGRGPPASVETASPGRPAPPWVPDHGLLPAEHPPGCPYRASATLVTPKLGIWLEKIGHGDRRSRRLGSSPTEAGSRSSYPRTYPGTPVWCAEKVPTLHHRLGHASSCWQQREARQSGGNGGPLAATASAHRALAHRSARLCAFPGCIRAARPGASAAAAEVFRILLWRRHCSPGEGAPLSAH